MAGNSNYQQYSTSAGRSMTKGYEGWRSAPYQDPGGDNQSIGWGFNMDEGGIPKDVVSGKREYSKKEAESLFQKKYTAAIKDSITFSGLDNFIKLSEGQRNVLIDMAYNMGLPTLNEFGGMQKAIGEQDYSRAALEMQYTNPDKIDRKETPWYKQTGGRARNHVGQILGGD